MINRVPQPALMIFTLHKTPHLIHFGFCDFLDDDVNVQWINVQWINRLEYIGVHLLDDWCFFLSVSITVAELTPRTRTISRTPLPFSVMSTMYRFTSGSRPLSWYCKRKIVRGQSTLSQR